MKFDVAVVGAAVMAPGGAVSLKLSTSTQSGVPLGGADVKLKWTLQRNEAACGRSCAAVPRTTAADDDDEEETAGEEHLTTGADGTLTVAWRPGVGASPSTSSPASERLGDSYELEFEWIGPTRERLTYPDSGGALSVPVALSELSVSLDAPSEAAPHHPFDVTVHVSARRPRRRRRVGCPHRDLALSPRRRRRRRGDRRRSRTTAAITATRRT